MLTHRRKAASVFAAIGIATLALAGCSGGTGDSVDGEGSVQEVEVSGESGPSSFSGGVFESSLVTIKITESKVIQQGEPGNEYGEAPVVAFWYETTNVAGQAADPLTAWLTHFRSYQDNAGERVELSLAMAPDEALIASQTEPIEEGATATNAVAYRLDNGSSPVEVLALDTRLNEVGSLTFPLQ